MMRAKHSEYHSVELFKALSDQTRQLILALLSNDERNVNELCQSLRHMTQPTVSHHLQILKRCELVSSRKQGKMVFYAMNKRLLRERFGKYIARFEIRVI